MTESEEPVLIDDVVDYNNAIGSKFSPKKSNNLLKRISMFDTSTNPADVVRKGSGTVSRTKLRKSEGQADRGSVGSASELPGLYDKPLTSASAHVQSGTRKLSSVQQRLNMFEQRNKETKDLSISSTHIRRSTQPKRVSSVNRYTRQDSKKKIDYPSPVEQELNMNNTSGKSSEHSRRSQHVRRSISVGGAVEKFGEDISDYMQSDDDDEFASSSNHSASKYSDDASALPRKSYRKHHQTMENVQEKLEREMEEAGIEPNLDSSSHHSAGTGVRAFNRPDSFDVPSSAGSGKRSWKPKSKTREELADLAQPPLDDPGSNIVEETVAVPLSERTDSNVVDEEEEAPPKRSWKVKRELSVDEVSSSRRNDDDDEEEDKPPKRSWKVKREISAAEVDGTKISDSMEGSSRSISHGSTHSNSSPTTIRRSWKPKAEVESKVQSAPNSPQKSSLNGSTHGRRSGKLKDRINMFNSGATPKTKPAFLSKKYMKKLVKKEPAEDQGTPKTEDEKAGVAESSDASPETATTEATTKAEQSNVNDQKTEEKPPEQAKISLDRKRVQEDDKKKKAKYRTKSFITRGMLKSSKSALVGQKNKDKNAVFVNVMSQAEDLSSFKMKEVAKDAADTKIIMNALRKNFVFEEMEDQDMMKLVGAMEQVKVNRGTKIIEQGAMGDYFYVIGRGDVSFIVNGKKVGSTKEGNAFGELALLYNCARAATVVADTQPTTLFRVDEKAFRFMMQSQTKKSEEEKKKLIQNVPFLSNLASEDLNRLCSVMKPVLFSTGDYIVKKGEFGTSFFILREGRVRVTDIFVGGTSYEDIFLGVGDYFGEDALISDEPRAANVVALTKGSAFSVDRESVHKVLGDFGSLISKAQDRHKLESMKILRDADLTSSDFEELAKLICDKSYMENATIFFENDRIRPALYIVREGSVRIQSSDGSRDEVIGIGGAFGQDQLLAGSDSSSQSKNKVKATYTASVLTDCICGILTLEDCQSVIDTDALGDRIFAGGNTELETKRAAMRDLMKSNVKYEDLDRDRLLGEGQFGTVWLVRADPKGTNDKSRMLEFAMKCQYKEDPVRKDGAIEAIKREMTVIQQLNHPFIIDLVDTYETEDQLMMLTEAVKGGELWSRIHQEDDEGNWTSGLSESDARFYALVVADTLAYMHRQKFVFRDLKPENVLIDAEGYPTLCDFGFAKYCPDKTLTFCGTPNYLAPEIVLNRGHGAAVDHWALGIVVYEMITGENPFYFEGQDQMALLQAIVQEAYYPLPKTASPEVVDFMDGLMEKDPVQRLGSLANGEKGILKHKWFSELDINDVRNKRAKAPYIPDIS